MNKKGFTLVEVIATVALLAILIGLAGTSLIKKYNESKKEAIIIQEEQLIQSGDMVIQDYCKNPLSDGYQLQCDNYYQSYEDNNDNLIIEDDTYTKYICVKDLKKLGYYSEELRYSGVDCSGVVVYIIDYETDLQKESYSVIKCGEDYTTEVENVEEYLTNFKECFEETSGDGETQVAKEYLLTVNFTELTPNGMKVGQSHSKKYKKGDSVTVPVPAYSTVANEYTPFKHGSSVNANSFNLSSDKTKLNGTMPEGNVTVNIVYSASTYVLTINYKEFNGVQGNITFPSKQFIMFYGEEVEIPYETKENFKVISPSDFTYEMGQNDDEIDVIYQQEKFNLTYNSNGGTACSSRQVTYNQPYGTLCSPTRTGYTFNGWYLNGSKITSSTVNTNYNNITLTANWTANKYVVIYNCNGGTPTSSYSSEHTYDQTSNLANNQCSKTGSVFTGWLGSNGVIYTNQQSIKNLLSKNNSSITLTAQWSPLSYYVAFAANGGSGTMGKMTVTYGRVVNLTTNAFTRTGHRFDGWSGSDGKTYADREAISNLTTVHGSTITMTAKWTKCGAGTYLVNNVCTACAAGTYSAGGVNSCTACPAGKYTSSTGQSSCATCAAGTYNTGTGNTTCKSCEAGSYNTGTAQTSCTTCQAGYYCTGGTHRAACATGYTSNAGASSCIAINYTVTIGRNNTSYGTVSSGTVSIPYGTTYSVSSNKITFSNGVIVTASPTAKTGYTTKFGNWSSSSGTITGNTTITANFTRTANKYAVIYNCNGGTPTSSYSSEHTYDVSKNLTSNSCSKTGYVFAGWLGDNGVSYSNNQSVVNLKTNNNDSITLTAQWTALSYNIAFAANGGSGSMSTISATYGRVITLPANAFTRTGHRFDGWAGSNGTNYSDKASVSNLTTVHNSTVTMTARWTKCGAGKYLSGNTCTSCPAGKYSTGGVNSCSTCSAGTYSGTGASSCTSCARGYTSSAGASSCNAIVYTIKYSCGSGSGSVSSQSIPYDSGVTIKTSGCTKTGYTLSGWTTNSNETNDGHGWSNWSGTWKYIDGQYGISGTTLQLYPMWSPNKIKITLDPNGGSGGTQAFWYYYGTSKFYSNEACTNQITSISRPTRTGYSYVHYNGDGTSGGNDGERYVAYEGIEFASDLATDIYKDATFKAKWNINSYTVSVNKGSNISSVSGGGTYTYGSTVTVSASAPTGYSFSGWSGSYSSSNATYSFTMPANNVSLTANGSINSYTNTVNHVVIGGDVAGNAYLENHFSSTTFAKNYGSTVTFNSGIATTAPNGTTLSHFGTDQLAGSWTGYSLGNTVSQPAKAFAVNCYYRANVYNITYNLNGGTNHSSNPSQYTVLYGVTLQNPTRSGYFFAGWTDQNGNRVTGINQGATPPSGSAMATGLNGRRIGDITLTANWIEAVTITYYKTAEVNWAAATMFPNLTNETGPVYGSPNYLHAAVTPPTGTTVARSSLEFNNKFSSESNRNMKSMNIWLLGTYYWQNPNQTVYGTGQTYTLSVPKGTKLTFTVNNHYNHGQVGAIYAGNSTGDARLWGPGESRSIGTYTHTVNSNITVRANWKTSGDYVPGLTEVIKYIGVGSSTDDRNSWWDVHIY